MDLAVSAILGISDPTGRILVRPGLLHQPAILARPQVNTRVTALRPDGLGWEEHGADTPRFPGPAGRLLLEGQRTNMVRNPRAEGAEVGTPGTLPLNWGAAGPGLVRSVVGLGTEDGIPFVDIRISGTATSSHYTFTGESHFAHVSAANGQVWTHSIFARMISGLPRSTRCHLRQVTSTGGIAGDVVVTAPVFTSGRLAECRMVATGTLNQAATTRLHAFHQVNFTVDTVIDDTWRLGWSQLEQGASASTPILPPIGTPGAATRGGDIVTAALASLGIAGNGACTLLWSGVLPALPPAGSANFDLLNLDDGGTVNRIVAYVNGGGASLFFGRVTAGASSVLNLGAIAGGTPFRFGLSHDGAGRAACSLNGGAPLNVTGAPTSGYTTLRLGSAAFGTAPIFGETAAFRVLPYALPDAALPGAVAALPGG